MEMTKREIFMLSFLEGGLVMLLELTVPHALAPIIGNSMNTWSILILLSVGGLAIGYFLGSMLASKLKEKSVLFTLLYLCFIVELLAFVLYFQLNQSGIFSNEVLSAYILAFLSLLVPITLLSSITPLLIKSYSNFNLSPGFIFSISTFGGVLFTLITGFVIIPDFGIMSAFQVFLLINSVMIALCGWSISRNSRSLILVAIVIGISSFIFSKATITSDKFSILEMKEGLNGQLLVVDENLNDSTIQRTLFINRMGQTMVRITNGSSISSVWSYAGIIKSLATYHGKKPSKALVLGLGGGIVPLFLSNKNEFNY
jgi:predicted membrane-bound spermidine synthase